ncbi:Mom family adenine methylcarbamoylation protein [Thomasclavelia sp.]
MQEIPGDMAIAFIRKYHYSKVIPRLCRYFLGIYHVNRLAGVVELGWGTQPLQTIRKIFPQHGLVTADYLEIGKMCFLPEMNHTQYFGSLALSTLIRWLRANTGCLFLYTLADGIEGKCGYVYQASNFYYLGSFKTSVYRDSKTGEKIHPRSARILLEENARFDEVGKRHWLTHDFCEYKGIEKINGLMFRYIYPLTQEAAKLLKCYPGYTRGGYPKGDSLYFEKRISSRKYERIQPPRFDKNIRCYNTQAYDR